MKKRTNVEKVMQWAKEKRTMSVAECLSKVTYEQDTLKGLQVTLRTLKNKGLIQYSYIAGPRCKKLTLKACHR